MCRTDRASEQLERRPVLFEQVLSHKAHVGVLGALIVPVGRRKEPAKGRACRIWVGLYRLERFGEFARQRRKQGTFVGRQAKLKAAARTRADPSLWATDHS